MRLFKIKLKYIIVICGHKQIKMIRNTSVNTCNDEVRNAWSGVSTHPYVCMAWYLISTDDVSRIKHWDKFIMGRSSSATIVTTLQSRRRGFESRQRTGFVASPRRPVRHWGPPSLLSSKHRGSYLGGKAAEVWSWPLTSTLCRG